MKQKRFTVEQIVAVLKQADAGVPLAELLRRVGVSELTFYRWKKQYVGLEVDQVRQLKQLQEENTRLKQLVADLTLDEYLHGNCRVSERRACRVARMNRATFRYPSYRDPRTELRMRIREVAQARVRWLLITA